MPERFEGEVEGWGIAECILHLIQNFFPLCILGRGTYVKNCSTNTLYKAAYFFLFTSWNALH